MEELISKQSLYLKINNYHLFYILWSESEPVLVTILGPQDIRLKTCMDFWEKKEFMV